MARQSKQPSGASGEESDVVSLLTRQHNDIRRLFDEVEASKGEERRDAFRHLVRLLAVHEAAEEEVVHPYARRAFEGGDEVVEARLTEEREAKEVLSRLEHLDPDDAGFLPQIQELRRSVEAHADAEERLEFPHLTGDETKMRGMAVAVRAAEAVAPTHPHPGTETAGKHMVTGPMAAIMDRARDAIRKVRRD